MFGGDISTLKILVQKQHDQGRHRITQGADEETEGKEDMWGEGDTWGRGRYSMIEGDMIEGNISALNVKVQELKVRWLWYGVDGEPNSVAICIK